MLPTLLKSRWARRGCLVPGGLFLCVVIGGCAAPGAGYGAIAREVELAARPILEMDPDANWTECYNRLIELGPVSVDYLLAQPLMHRRSAPDDLRVMLHISLLRLLANPTVAPPLSVNCFETTLDLLHFDPKVRGRRLGTVRIPTRHVPWAWHDLYPADFDQRVARVIDVEADRQIMLLWWERQSQDMRRAMAFRRLYPNSTHLWSLLSRRFADAWSQGVWPEVYRCSSPPGQSVLFRGVTYDYNLTRAACIWLGMAEEGGTQRALIELVGHASEVMSYNARFALQYSRDPRIRDLMQRYNEEGGSPAPMGMHACPETVDSVGSRASPASLHRVTCGEQGSATHEMAEIRNYMCLRGRDRHLYGGTVWWD